MDDVPTMPESSDQTKLSASRDIPAPRERRERDEESTLPPLPEDQIRIDVTKASAKSRLIGPNPIRTKPSGEMAGFEHWEDTTDLFKVSDLPSIVVMTDSSKEERPQEIEIPAPIAQNASQNTTPLEPARVEDDELSPKASEKKVSSTGRLNLRLSPLERIGILLLVVMLLLVGTVAYMFSLHRLASETTKIESLNFPIKGKQIVINSATGYWRTPVITGPSQDVCRRGTQFLPVVELNTSSDSAVVRVIFRDDGHNIVGDPITRVFSGKETVTIAATAGFEDTGMFAAYRTGGSKSWTIEVLEAPSVNSESADCNKLFEMNVSTTLR